VNRSAVIAVVLLVIVAVLAWWFLRGEPAPEVTPPVPAPVAAPVAPVEPAGPPLPELVASDDLTRDLAAEFGMMGAMAELLLADEQLITQFVRVVDAIATGASPAARLASIGPAAPFAVTETGEEIFVDPASYGRYDGVAEAIAGVDADRAVAAFRRVEPLCDQAYSDLVGQPSAFRPVLMEALRVLLAVPVVTEPPELVDAINRYRYADPTLEGLTEPQKHLLRMGPANVGRVQARLRQIARLLG
jgi:hypothetical protein